MADPRGFLRHRRDVSDKRDPAERVGDYNEIFRVLPTEEVRRQADRCMDCGVPFCHQGCPLGNRIPRWNELVAEDDWREALAQLEATNDFPEFTGFTCPAPCEPACVLEINDDPVMIKQVELAIVERGFEEGWITPEAPPRRTGHRVAVVGSGPAGLAVANQCNRDGHEVTVLERDETVGGLLRLGIPDFKLEKHVIDRRVDLLDEEGIAFRTGAEVGTEVTLEELEKDFDAVVLAVGARVQRPLRLEGVELDGVAEAMDYLYQRNRAIARRDGQPAPPPPPPGRHLTAEDRHVVVIGGGDTAADCIANAHREGAASVTQLDRYPEPEGDRPREIAGWPRSPKRLPKTYATEEGGEQRWGQTATRIVGEDGHVTAIEGATMSGPPAFDPVEGTGFTLPADLVLVAIGFLGAEPEGVAGRVGLDDDTTIATDGFETSRPGVFAAGDGRRGPSLVVWAIDEGRRCARAVDRHLTGRDQDGPITPQASTWPAGLADGVRSEHVPAQGGEDGGGEQE